jgi:hypothetical protein
MRIISGIGCRKSQTGRKAPTKRASHRAYFMSSFLVSLAVGIFTSVM